MAIQLQSGERDIKRIVDALIQALQGRQNSVGDVTLTPGATSTTKSFPNCSKDCRVFLFPQTPHAATLFATGNVYILKANILQSSFVITHPSSANVDNNYSFLCIGG